VRQLGGLVREGSLGTDLRLPAGLGGRGERRPRSAARASASVDLGRRLRRVPAVELGRVLRPRSGASRWAWAAAIRGPPARPGPPSAAAAGRSRPWRFATCSSAASASSARRLRASRVAGARTRSCAPARSVSAARSPRYRGDRGQRLGLLDVAAQTQNGGAAGASAPADRAARLDDVAVERHEPRPVARAGAPSRWPSARSRTRKVWASSWVDTARNAGDRRRRRRPPRPRTPGSPAPSRRRRRGGRSRSRGSSVAQPLGARTTARTRLGRLGRVDDDVLGAPPQGAGDRGLDARGPRAGGPRRCPGRRRCRRSGPPGVPARSRAAPRTRRGRGCGPAGRASDSAWAAACRSCARSRPRRTSARAASASVTAARPASRAVARASMSGQGASPPVVPRSASSAARSSLREARRVR
jgi:hypothetical protein